MEVEANRTDAFEPETGGERVSERRLEVRERVAMVGEKAWLRKPGRCDDGVEKKRKDGDDGQRSGWAKKINRKAFF